MCAGGVHRHAWRVKPGSGLRPTQRIALPTKIEDGSGDDDHGDVDANGSDKDEPADAEDDFLDTAPVGQDEHL